MAFKPISLCILFIFYTSLSHTVLILSIHNSVLNWFMVVWHRAISLIVTADSGYATYIYGQNAVDMEEYYMNLLMAFLKCHMWKCCLFCYESLMPGCICTTINKQSEQKSYEQSVLYYSNNSDVDKYSTIRLLKVWVWG